jgi:hypothetical protein
VSFILDPSFVALRWLLGDEIPDSHPFASPIMTNFLASYERRYARLMNSAQVRFGRGRIDETRRRLAELDQLRAADAELQTASTVAASAGNQVDAPDAGAVPGMRSADFVVRLGGTEVDLEVRTLSDVEDERRADAVADRITKRLKLLPRPTGLGLWVRVRKVTPALRTENFDRGLVGAVRKLLAGKNAWVGSAYVTLTSNGVARVWSGRESLADELLGIELRESKAAGFIGSTSGLRAPTEAERVMTALKKKSERKQHAGNRPWVIALDTSGTGLFVDQDLVRGARAFLQTSRRVSAVVLQRRTLRADGGFSFRARIVSNPEAAYPLSAAEAAVFEIDEP